jgi:phosphoserine phosphatase RsbU/P
MRTTPLILIIEDNPASLEIMNARLSAHGYNIITAVDGAQGFDLALQKLPDLILSDIMMPKMDGLEVCRRLKNDPDIPFIPIILVTAKTDTKDIVVGLEAGADEYLTKPIEHTSLVARVKSMLRIKDLHDVVLEQSNQLKIQLKTATKVQELFFPKTREVSERVNIWTYRKPASYVGGDLFDVIELNDGSVLVYLADISGKGVAAALIMAALSTMIRAEAPFYNDIVELLTVVNRSMVNLSSDEGYFATVVCGRYWPENGRLQLLRAGHPFPLWITEGSVNGLPWLEGSPLGIQEEVHYDTSEIYLAEGDSCLFYSDGVTEAENQDRVMFGVDRLHGCLGGQTDPPWGPCLIEALAQWRGETELNDDTTIVEIHHESL